MWYENEHFFGVSEIGKNFDSWFGKINLSYFSDGFCLAQFLINPSDFPPAKVAKNNFCNRLEIGKKSLLWHWGFSTKKKSDNFL